MKIIVATIALCLVAATGYGQEVRSVSYSVSYYCGGHRITSTPTKSWADGTAYQIFHHSEWTRGEDADELGSNVSGLSRWRSIPISKMNDRTNVEEHRFVHVDDFWNGFYHPRKEVYQFAYDPYGNRHILNTSEYLRKKKVVEVAECVIAAVNTNDMFAPLLELNDVWNLKE